MGPNKFVHLLFAIGSLLLAFVLSRIGDWLWGYFAQPNDLLLNGAALLLGVAAGFVAYRNDRVFTAAVEVTRELEKVTWPTRKETYAATVVVMVMVGISAIIFTSFDYVWSFLAGQILH